MRIDPGPGRNAAQPGQAAAGRCTVVPFATSGPATAFALHTVGGSVQEYAALARCLDGACAVSGIEAAGLRPGTRPAGSLAAMADRYADALMTAQPTDPYRLIGWSMGGVLAYETAWRLEAAGRRVDLVALVDAPCRTPPLRSESPEAMAALFVADALRTRGRTPDCRPWLSVTQQLARLAADRSPEPVAPALLLGDLERRFAVFLAHTEALAGYRAGGHLDAPAVLVSAHGSRDSTPYWRRLFRGGVRAVSTMAGHYGCLRPPAVATVAAVIREAL